MPPKLRLLIFLMCAAVVSALNSCKKCENCSFSYTWTDSTGEHTASYSGDVCGKNSDIDQLRKDCDNAAAPYGVSCNCTSQ